MDDLISRAAAIEAMRECWRRVNQFAKPFEANRIMDCIRAVKELPAVDAVPVVHGRWKSYSVPHWTKRYDDNGDPEYKYHNEYVCSICRRRTIVCENYCSRCGARMDGERRDDDG